MSVLVNGISIYISFLFLVLFSVEYVMCLSAIMPTIPFWILHNMASLFLAFLVSSVSHSRWHWLYCSSRCKSMLLSSVPFLVCWYDQVCKIENIIAKMFGGKIFGKPLSPQQWFGMAIDNPHSFCLMNHPIFNNAQIGHKRQGVQPNWSFDYRKKQDLDFSTVRYNFYPPTLGWLEEKLHTQNSTSIIFQLVYFASGL